MILVCGHNEKLAAGLRRLAVERGAPVFVEGFTKEVPRYMQLADYFIGKPGPGSISEALQFHLPVIVECNGRTLPQERYNAQWVREKQVGIVVKSHREVAGAVAALLKPGELEQFRARAAAMDNRAIFEIPLIFEKMLDETPEKVLAESESKI